MFYTLIVNKAGGEHDFTALFHSADERELLVDKLIELRALVLASRKRVITEDGDVVTMQGLDFKRVPLEELQCQ